MSNLSSQQIKNSFQGILQVPGGVTSTLQTVQDGNGNSTGLQLSTNGIGYVTSSELTQFTNNGTVISGTIERPISDAFGDYVNVHDFGATGNGTTDDTAAINAALATGRLVRVPQGTYKITATLVVPAGGGIVGDGEKTQFVRAFNGGRLIGVPSAAGFIGCAVILRDFTIITQAGITAIAGDDGIDIGYSGGWNGRGNISNLFIYEQWNGMSWTGGSSNVIDNIVCNHNRNHGFNIINGRGPLTNCLATYNFGDGYHYYMATQAETGIVFVNCGTFANKGYGFYYGAASGVIGANIWMTTSGSSTDGLGGVYFATEYRQIWISDFLIESAGDAYIPHNTQYPADTPWVVQPTAPGLVFSGNCRVMQISNGFIQTCNGTGVFFDGCYNGVFENLVISDNGRGGGSAAHRCGINFLNNVGYNNNSLYFSNIQTGIGSSQIVDIAINGALTSDAFFTNTSFRTISDYAGAARFAGNIKTSASNAVASASTVSLLNYTDFISITGTTNIDAITASYAGRKVTLIFSGVLVVQNGNNLYLSAALSTTANDTLTLVCDGTNWYEVSRSVNR